MKISIIIPSWNNLEYLKTCIESLLNNSFFENEIIIHVNEGTDGTVEYLTKKNIKFTFSKENIGICSSVNLAYKKTTNDYILYSNDDMYFSNHWDKHIGTELLKIKDNLFYLTAKSVSPKNDIVEFNCGKALLDFDKNKFEDFCKNDNSVDLKASHLSPFIVHTKTWKLVEGFSEEFNPGDGSDPDFCMKLWKNNVRIFKCLSSFKIYHFGSITTRREGFKINNGTKTFLLKWGFSPRFFRTYYMGASKNIAYDGPRKIQNKSFKMLKNLFFDKIKYLLYKIF